VFLLNNSNFIRQAFWFKLMYSNVKNFSWTKQRANSLRVFPLCENLRWIKESIVSQKKQNNDCTLLPGKGHPLGCAFAVLVLRGILKCATLWAQPRGSNLEAQSRHSEAKIHRLNLGILRLKSQRLNYRRSISAIEVRGRPTVYLFLSKWGGGDGVYVAITQLSFPHIAGAHRFSPPLHKQTAKKSLLNKSKQFSSALLRYILWENRNTIW